MTEQEIRKHAFALLEELTLSVAYTHKMPDGHTIGIDGTVFYRVRGSNDDTIDDDAVAIVRKANHIITIALEADHD